MPYAPRKISAKEKSLIRKNASEVRARRRALGLTQVELDRECGFTVATVYRVERFEVDHRSPRSNDPLVGKILGNLDRLERTAGPAPGKPRTRDIKVSRTRRQEARSFEPVTLEATLKRCPDHSVWTTQAGCDAMRERNPICQSLRSGRGCRGVNHRRGLERKDIEVEYKPPTEAELEEQPKRFGRVS